MQRARLLILRHPASAAILLLATLLLRMLVPAGYMPAIDGGAVTLVFCPGMTPSTTLNAADHAMPMGHARAAMHLGDRQERQDHPRAEQPCGFAGIGLAALGGADPVLLVAAIAFAFLLATRAVPLRLSASRIRFRPPLRAPPLIA